MLRAQPDVDYIACCEANNWSAEAGCLAHARYDFPFQIHSIVFLFLVVCAILINLTRRP